MRIEEDWEEQVERCPDGDLRPHIEIVHVICDYVSTDKDPLGKKDINIHGDDVFAALALELHAAMWAVTAHRPVPGKQLALMAGRAALKEPALKRAEKGYYSTASYGFLHCGSCCHCHDCLYWLRKDLIQEQVDDHACDRNVHPDRVRVLDDLQMLLVLSLESSAKRDHR